MATPLDLSRRRFLQLAATASAGAMTLPKKAWAGSPNDVFNDGTADVPGGLVGEPERVIVVGAGFAGLAAANALANAGVEVVVLEGRDRIGGRAHTRDVSGLPVDQGCSWIHDPIGNPMSRWAEQLGVATFAADYQSDINTFNGFDPVLGTIDRTQIVVAFFQTLLFDNELFRLYSALPPRSTVDDAIRLYFQTAPVPDEVRRLAEPAIRLIYETGIAAPANDIALEPLLFFPPGSGGHDYFGSDVFPRGGYRALLDPLAAGLDVRLGHRVLNVQYGPDGVVVHTQAREGRRRKPVRFEGSHVLITLPLGVLKAQRVGFAPYLPVPKVRSIERLGLGFLEKVTIGFDEPFWQADGKTHILYNSATPGEFTVFLDQQHISGGPVLQSFVGGDFGRRMSRMSRGAVERRVLEILKEVFGTVPKPRETLVTRWFSDPFSMGSYSALPVGAGYDDNAAMAEPVGGRVLFAGEATHTERSSTADGAFSSGVREAKRLLAQPSVRIRPVAGPLASNESWLSRIARLRREAAA